MSTMPDTLVQVAQNVWIFPRDEDPYRYQPNVGIIVAGSHTILVGAGNSPRHARRVLLSLDKNRHYVPRLRRSLSPLDE